MSVESSKSVLKIVGIICIVLGVMGILGAILLLGGGGLAVAVSGGDEELAAGGAIALAGGVVALLASIVRILEGFFSVKAAKDSSKIMPAWIFAVIGVVSHVISLLANLQSGFSGILNSITGLAFSALVFIAANTIKKSME